MIVLSLMGLTGGTVWLIVHHDLVEIREQQRQFEMDVVAVLRKNTDLAATTANHQERLENILRESSKMLLTIDALKTYNRKYACAGNNNPAHQAIGGP